MLKNFFRVALRNLTKNRASSIINIGGLAVGMAVALLIGLWMHDEFSFNKNFKNYDRIGKLWQFVKFGAEKSSYDVMPIPLAADLRTRFPDFQGVALASINNPNILAIGDKKISISGTYAQPDFTTMLGPTMLAGSSSLKAQNSMLLAQSTAKALFGDANPIGQTLTVNKTYQVTVTGVYKDFPFNSSFKDVSFLGPWDLYAANDGNAKGGADTWDNNSWNIFVQLKPGAGFAAVSAKIKNARTRRVDPPKYNPEFFAFPMSRWYLYGDFRDGVNTGGSITFVWLFGIIGVFVLLLACINFMNLSTARSEKRAKEVGIRKAIGSLRTHLIGQFLSESVLIAIISFVLALLLAQTLLPFFNDLSNKQMHMPWTNPVFWASGIGFSAITGLIAGSYPALYLSSFRPVKVLKGSFKAGRAAAIPRKVLVVVQFTVSVTLIICTSVVFRQIQFVKDQPVGYTQHGLIELNINTPELQDHFGALRNQLLRSGAVVNVSSSSCSITEQNGGTTDFQWTGKDPNNRPLVMSNYVTSEYGRVLNWKLTAGHDFTGNYLQDSGKVIINESMVKLTGFKDHPIGQTVQTNNGNTKLQVIGVIKDFIKESPYEAVKPSFFVVSNKLPVMNIRLNPNLSTSEAIARVGAVYRSQIHSSPFTYDFVDDNYGKKFGNEQRIGKLAGFFAALAIFISCLGLFGLVSFVAEQRTREIGVRKVLGATVLNVWSLLSGEFIILVGVSLLIAIPVAWHYMGAWLQNYDIRTPLSWWIFAAAGAGAFVITLATISVQAVKAALANPVKSLRAE